jgi:hypothetical protein
VRGRNSLSRPIHPHPPSRVSLSPKAPRICALILLSLVLAFGTSCQPPKTEGEAGAAAGLKRDSSEGWKAGDEWSLLEVTRIGSTDDSAYVFSRIVDVALDEMGRVWVADGQENRIRVFASDGRHVRSLGRSGGGPAEFLGIAGMDWGPDGNLWVLDGGNMRFAVYDTTGALVATHRRNSSTVVAPWPLGFDAENRLYDLGSSHTAGQEPRTILRLDPDLQPRDSFELPEFKAPVFEIVNRQGEATSIEQVTVPFAGLQEWRVDRQGFVWVGMTDRYRLERYRFDGTLERVVERQIEPEPIPRGRRRNIAADYRDFERRGGRIDVSRIPDTYPVFDGFFFGEDGTLWVKRTSAGRGAGTWLDVFGDDGAYLGTVETPVRLLISPAPVVRGGHMAAVVQDENQVESVVLMRIEKPAQ